MRDSALMLPILCLRSCVALMPPSDVLLRSRVTAHTCYPSSACTHARQRTNATYPVRVLMRDSALMLPILCVCSCYCSLSCASAQDVSDNKKLPREGGEAPTANGGAHAEQPKEQAVSLKH